MPDTPDTSPPPDVAAILETMRWAVKGFGLTSQWMQQTDNSQRMLTEAIVDLGAKIDRLTDRMGVLEDLEARATELMANNSPPPVAKPMHTVTPNQKPARRAA